MGRRLGFIPMSSMSSGTCTTSAVICLLLVVLTKNGSSWCDYDWAHTKGGSETASPDVVNSPDRCTGSTYPLYSEYYLEEKEEDEEEEAEEKEVAEESRVSPCIHAARPYPVSSTVSSTSATASSSRNLEPSPSSSPSTGGHHVTHHVTDHVTDDVTSAQWDAGKDDARESNSATAEDFSEQSGSAAGSAGAASLPGPTAEASSNVFVEDLQATRGLETTYYVTDSTQAADFYWDRESGLRINIGILDVHVMPEYVAADHSGRDDNRYMLSHPHDSEDKIRFQNLIDNYCRHPVPEYYTLTLETAAASENGKTSSCNSSDVTEYGRCGKLGGREAEGGGGKGGRRGRKSGSRCVLNAQMDSTDQRRSVANSIVCTDESRDLLHRIFNQTQDYFSYYQLVNQRLSVGEAKSVTSPKCLEAYDVCRRCIASSEKCTNNTSDNKPHGECCLVDCYASLECRTAFSVQCRLDSPDCTTGTTYRYTIQPVFPSNPTSTSSTSSSFHSHTFRCHVTHRREPVLYTLFFYAQFPSSPPGRPVFPRASVTVSAGENLVYRRHGFYTVDFLTVEHDAGFELLDEFIVSGVERDVGDVAGGVVAGGGGGDGGGRRKVFDYSVAPAVLAYDPNDVMSSDDVSEVASNARLTRVRFERPFDYSTSTWNNACAKNITKFRIVHAEGQQQWQQQQQREQQMQQQQQQQQHLQQKQQQQLQQQQQQEHHQQQLLQREVQKQQVHVMIENTAEPYRYAIKSADNPPYFRFTVPGNKSILPYFFRNDTNVLLLGSLSASLQQLNHAWRLRLTGRMSGCPAYLNVVVNDVRRSTQCFHYDLLISCPSNFELTFNIPLAAINPADKNSDVRDPTSFQVRLTDIQRSFHDIYVTHLSVRSNRRQGVVNLAKYSANNTILSLSPSSSAAALFTFRAARSKRGVILSLAAVVICLTLAIVVIMIFVRVVTGGGSRGYNGWRGDGRYAARRGIKRIAPPGQEFSGKFSKQHYQQRPQQQLHQQQSLQQQQHENQHLSQQQYGQKQQYQQQPQQYHDQQQHPTQRQQQQHSAAPLVWNQAEFYPESLPLQQRHQHQQQQQQQPFDEHYVILNDFNKEQYYETTATTSQANSVTSHPAYFDVTGPSRSIRPDPSTAAPPPRRRARKSSSNRRLLLTFLYVGFRVVYSLTFNITVLSAIMLILTRSDVEILVDMNRLLKTEQGQIVSNATYVLDRRWTVEQSRLQRGSVSRLCACNHYINDLYISILQHISLSPLSYSPSHPSPTQPCLHRSLQFHPARTTRNSDFFKLAEPNALLVENVLMHVTAQLQRYALRLSEFTERYRTSIAPNTISSPAARDYKRFLDELFLTPWFSLAQELFANQTKNARAGASTKPKVSSSPIGWGGSSLPTSVFSVDVASSWNSLPVEFSSFLGLDEVEKIHIWWRQFWEKYEGLLPVVPSLPNMKTYPPFLTGGTIPITTGVRGTKFNTDVGEPQKEAFSLSRGSPSVTGGGRAREFGAKGDVDEIRGESCAGYLMTVCRTTLSHLNAYRYFAADVVYGDVTNGRNEEAKERTSLHQPPRGRLDGRGGVRSGDVMMMSPSELIASVNTLLVWVIYLCLESVLLIYRLCLTHNNAVTIYNCLRITSEGVGFTGRRHHPYDGAGSQRIEEAPIKDGGVNRKCKKRKENSRRTDEKNGRGDDQEEDDDDDEEDEILYTQQLLLQQQWNDIGDNSMTTIPDVKFSCVDLSREDPENKIRDVYNTTPKSHTVSSKCSNLHPSTTRADVVYFNTQRNNNDVINAYHDANDNNHSRSQVNLECPQRYSSPIISVPTNHVNDSKQTTPTAAVDDDDVSIRCGCRVCDKRSSSPCLTAIIDVMFVRTILAIVTVTLLVCYSLETTSAVLDAGTMRAVDPFRSLVRPLVVQIQLMNVYADQDRRHIDDMISENYFRQLHVQLVNLQSFINQYNNDTCTSSTPLRHSMCDVVTLRHIDVDLLPCNFVPIAPNFFKDSIVANTTSLLHVSFERYSSAFQNFLRVIQLLTLLAALVMIVVNALESFLVEKNNRNFYFHHHFHPRFHFGHEFQEIRDDTPTKNGHVQKDRAVISMRETSLLNQHPLRGLLNPAAFRAPEAAPPGDEKRRTFRELDPKQLVHDDLPSGSKSRLISPTSDRTNNLASYNKFNSSRIKSDSNSVQPASNADLPPRSKPGLNPDLNRETGSTLKCGQIDLSRATLDSRKTPRFQKSKQPSQMTSKEVEKFKGASGLPSLQPGDCGFTETKV